MSIHDLDHLTDPDRLLTPAALAERWGVSRGSVYNLLAAGLPSVKIGRARRIRVREADAWLGEQQGAA